MEIKMKSIISKWVILIIIVTTIQFVNNVLADTSGIIATHEAPPFFTANQTITVNAEIIHSYTLTALGMIVTLPEGWQFIRTSGANPSDITPKEENKTVSFGWMYHPFPQELSFSYDIKAPAYARSDIIIRAKILYRIEDSEEQYQLVIPIALLVQADIDLDNDGYITSQDAFPDDPTEWVDTDGDNIGDNADDDDDNDGMKDDWEIEHGFSTTSYNADDDPDFDGISNYEEYKNGSLPLNFRPDLPSLISPADQETPLTPTLRIGAFHDGNESDTHYATDWQICLNGDFEHSLVYELKTISNQLELKLPNFLLDPNTQYHWRARHYDNHDESSPWDPLSSQSFQTMALINFDKGVPIAQKVPDDVDLDNNGVYDNQQDSIKSLTSIVGDVQVGMKSEYPSQYTITMARSIDPESIEDTYNRPDQLPFGMLAFKIKVESPGDIAVITAHYSTPLPEETLWYTYDFQDGWQFFRPQLSSDRRTVTLVLKDGGNGDADGIPNGYIVDPSGPGILDTEEIPDTPIVTPELVDDADNGSCFINSVLMK